jgi:hypothetical protein
MYGVSGFTTTAGLYKVEYYLTIKVRILHSHTDQY